MSATVKVTNKTKDAKGVLAQFRLVDVDLECCGEMVPAGGSITVATEDWLLSQGQYARLLKLGALAVEDVAEEKPVGPALVSLSADTSVVLEEEAVPSWKKKKKVDQEGG